MGLKHLGIIADGNRRWAKERGLPTLEGHKKGLDSISKLVQAASGTEIEYIPFTYLVRKTGGVRLMRWATS